MKIAIIALVIGYIIAFLNIKLQGKFLLRKLTMGNTDEDAIDAFGLMPVIIKTTVVYTIIFSALGYFLLAAPIPLKLLISLSIPAFSLFSTFLLRTAIKTFLLENPWYNDFSNYYKSTCVEYMKLRALLRRSNKKSYSKMTQNLWNEITDLNRRKHAALERVRDLQALKTDVIKLLDTYSYEGNDDKKERAQRRLRRIEEEIAQTDAFAAEVNDNMKKAETIFLDVRSNIALGDSERITTDISELTNKVKALEYTVNALEESSDNN